MRKINIGDRIYFHNEISGYCLYGTIEYIQPKNIDEYYDTIDYNPEESVYITGQKELIGINPSTWNDSIFGYVIEDYKLM